TAPKARQWFEREHLSAWRSHRRPRLPHDPRRGRRIDEEAVSSGAGRCSGVPQTPPRLEVHHKDRPDRTFNYYLAKPVLTSQLQSVTVSPNDRRRARLTETCPGHDP